MKSLKRKDLGQLKLSIILCLSLGASGHLAASIDYSTRWGLITTFAPKLYLHESDSFRPGNVISYLKECNLYRGEGELVCPNPSPIQLSQNYCQMGHSHYYLQAKSLTEPGEAIFGVPIEGGEYKGGDLYGGKCVAPCYVNFMEKMIPDNEGDMSLVGFVIQYIFFYPFNGPTIPGVQGQYGKPGFSEKGLNRLLSSCCGALDKDTDFELSEIGSHYGDFEHIDVHFKVGNGSLPELTRVYFAAHRSKRDGQFVEVDQLEMDGSHPIVYVSKHGHASHPHPIYFNEDADTTSNKGPTWDCWNHCVDLGKHHYDLLNHYTNYPQSARANTIQRLNITHSDGLKSESQNYFEPFQNSELEEDHSWLFFRGRFGKDGPRSPFRQSWWRYKTDQRTEVANLNIPYQHFNDEKSDLFSLRGKIPTRCLNLLWRLQGTYKKNLSQDDIAKIIFNINQKRFILKDREDLYGPLQGSGTITQIKALDKLYIPPIQAQMGKTNLKQKEHALLTLIVEALEE